MTKLDEIETIQMEFGNPASQMAAAKLAGLTIDDLMEVLQHYNCGIVAEFSQSSWQRELAIQAYLRTFFCLGVLAERKRISQKLAAM